MAKGRLHHACAMHGSEAFVAGGIADGAKTLEVWNGKKWILLDIPIDATGTKMISNGKKLILYGGLSTSRTDMFQVPNSTQQIRAGEKIWLISQDMKFVEIGNLEMSPRNYLLLTLRHSFLKRCKGIFRICARIVKL